MNKVLLIGLCMILVATGAYAEIYNVTITTNVPLQHGNGSYYYANSFPSSGHSYAEFLNSSILSWTCNSGGSTALISASSCTCIDTKTGIDASDGVGYGDIIRCLKESNGFVRVLKPISGAIDDVVIAIGVIYNTSPASALPSVTLSSSGPVVDRNADISCDVQGTLPTYSRYVFYRTAPFGIVYRGQNSNISLSNSRIPLFAGDEIKCQLLAYDVERFIGSSLSTNSVTIANTNVSARFAYIAPAYPTVLDTLYCYGDSLKDVSGAIDHTFAFTDNGIPVYSNTYTLNAAEAWQNVSLLPFHKGDTIDCTYTVSWGTNVSSYTSSVTIQNSKPSKPEVTISIT